VATIALEGVRKTFPNGAVGVRDVSLTVADGELLVLVGPSGSGKSSVLRLIAGLETASAGRILIDGRDVTEVPPQDRDLAMVFQSYALYPHLTVRDNLAFGLRMRRTPPAVVAERIARVASSLGIASLLDRKPAQLSGGQRQRVALGRALVREPRAFLFDEPLSNLDPGLRADTRAELSLLHRRLAATTVYVTHDQEEAMTLGTRMAVMRDGAVEQIGRPLDIYGRPSNTFVAAFVGSPAMNLLPGSMAFALGLDAEGLAPAGGRDVTVGLRPQDVELTPVSGEAASGSVEVIEPLGGATLVPVQARLRLGV
jgi:ABC-type sugar transport system ATPase subunit